MPFLQVSIVVVSNWLRQRARTRNSRDAGSPRHSEWGANSIRVAWKNFEISQFNFSFLDYDLIAP